MKQRLVKDQMGRSIWVPEFPKRIISLVPSQTELLYDLGLARRIAAQTIFCIHPSSAFKTAQKIGGTKKLNIQKIRSIGPDLIIGNKEENDKEQIETLSGEFPVWMSDIIHLEDALEMISEIGKLTDTLNGATDILTRIKHLIDSSCARHTSPKKAIYLIWKDPWMAAGNQTYIHEMMHLAGYQNLIKGRYPELRLEDIKNYRPQTLLLSSEPYPFKEQHINALQDHLPETKIQLVDGTHFSWYGSRMIEAISVFNQVKL